MTTPKDQCELNPPSREHTVRELIVQLLAAIFVICIVSVCLLFKLVAFVVTFILFLGILPFELLKRAKK